MRWETTVWMSAALVVATSALHLTIDHDLLGEESRSTSTTSSSLKGSEQDLIEQPTHTKSIEKDESVSRSAEKTSNGSDGRIYGEPEGGGDGGTSGDNEGEGNGEAEGGANGDNDDETNGGSEGGSNGGNESGGNGGSEGGSNGGNESGGNGGTEGGSNDGNESAGNGGSEGGSNDGNESGGNDGSEGGSNDGDESAGNGGSEDGSNGGNENGDSGSESNGGNDDELVVGTTTGPVQGYTWREKADIISYIDIQYGTFKHPFEAPVLPDAWEDTHQVKEHGKRCPQLQDGEYIGDDECLTLSIFKPLDAANAGVLVHIHEGNFIEGSADPALYGPEYLVSKGIILVLPNYRLGPLGFLCLQNETAPGNAALKDLTLALSWIKANIAKFGGNPENIAVSGDGTAGALAGYLALSPKSRHNISKVITESGSVLAHWAFDRNPIIAATHLVNKIDQFSTWQGIEMSTLMTAAKDVVLRPCLESSSGNGEKFMVHTPSAMIENQEIKIPFMIGSAKYAGAHEVLKHTAASIQQINDDVGLLLPNDLQFETSEEKNRIGNKVKNQYFGETAISRDEVERLSRYFTDAQYLGPGIRTARPLVNSGATVYFYEFSFVGELNRESDAIDLPVNGAVRGDIIGYLFTQDGVMPGEDTEERRMVDLLIELWTTFVRTGEPSAENVKWNKLEKTKDSEEEWLSIEKVPSTETGLYVDRLSLWTDIYNQYFIERNLAFVTSPSVYTVLVLQFTFFAVFFRNASHFF